MYQQLRRFLAMKHGPEWDLSLANVRRRTAQAAIRAGGPPPRKRKWGGPPQSVPPKAGPAEETRPVLSQRDLVLHLDADLGCQVLNRCSGGKWWDWSAGSSLAFWQWNGEEQVADARDEMRMFVKG
jgi:hypothetical protein